MQKTIIAAFLLLGLSVAGCNDGGGGGSTIRFTSTPEAAQAEVPTAPSGTAAIVVAGVRVVPPTWFPLDDHPHLAIAVDAYLRDAQAVFGGWTPQPAGTGQFPLTVILHDNVPTDLWNVTTRTAWLSWPRGATGKPRLERPMPALGEIFTLDRRRELGTSSDPWSQQDVDATTRSRSLPVVMGTSHPDIYDLR